MKILKYLLTYRSASVTEAVTAVGILCKSTERILLKRKWPASKYHQVHYYTNTT